MNKSKIYIISTSPSLIKNYEAINNSSFSIDAIVVKDNKSFYTALLKSYKEADLIVIMNNDFTYSNETFKIIKNADLPIIYCSLNKLEVEDKKSKITSLVPYVIDGFKENTNTVLLQSIRKILK